MHLAQLTHDFDWVTAGGSGADAGLTSDANEIQSAKIQTQRGSLNYHINVVFH